MTLWLRSPSSLLKLPKRLFYHWVPVVSVIIDIIPLKTSNLLWLTSYSVVTLCRGERDRDTSTERCFFFFFLLTRLHSLPMLFIKGNSPNSAWDCSSYLPLMCIVIIIVINVVWGLYFLLVHFLAPRNFFPSTPVFSSPQINPSCTVQFDHV